MINGKTNLITALNYIYRKTFNVLLVREHLGERYKMEINKELAIAMLAGAYAIKRNLQRNGASTYTLDPFNELGLKAEIDFVDAQNLLSKAALGVIYESEEE